MSLGPASYVTSIDSESKILQLKILRWTILDGIWYIFAGWWFGCHFFDFSHILGIIIPSGHHFPQVNQKLVGGLEHEFYFPINIGLLIIPIDELIFFQRGGPTTNQVQFAIGFCIQNKTSDVRSRSDGSQVQSAVLLHEFLDGSIDRRVFVLGMPRELVV